MHTPGFILMIYDLIKSNNTVVGNRLRFVIDKINWANITHVCDIGSWHLNQTLEFQNLLPHCKYSVFEPDPRNFQVCQSVYKSLPLHHQFNIDIFNLALGDINGQIEFWPVSDNNPGASSKLKLIPQAVQEYWNATWSQNSSVKVPSMQLDSWWKTSQKPPVDIIWIDVQGGEWDVFAYGQKVLETTKCIFTEVGIKPTYQGQKLKPEIDSMLLNAGFVEITESFEYNGSDCEANTIYLKKDLL